MEGSLLEISWLSGDFNEDDDHDQLDVLGHFLNHEKGDEDEISPSSLSNGIGTNDRVDSDSSSVSPLIVERRPKRKRNHIPRVVKNDVRRHYGTMLMNAFNMNSQAFLESFFASYAIPSFRTVMRQVDPASHPHIPSHLLRRQISKFEYGINVSGYDWLQFQHFFSHVMAPDLVVRLRDARLVTRIKDKRSMIVMETDFDLMYLFDVDILEVLLDMFTLTDHSSSEETERTVPFTTTYCPPIVKPMIRGKLRAPITRSHGEKLCPSSFVSFDYTKRRLAKPQHFTMRTQMMFIVDEHRRIESLTIGNGRLPADALAALEAKAAALELQQS